MISRVAWRFLELAMRNRGNGTNSKPINLFCNVCSCAHPGHQKLAEITHDGIEIISRHHGTYHTGSLSIQEILRQVSGTTDGSAVLSFVREVLGNG